MSGLDQILSAVKRDVNAEAQAASRALHKEFNQVATTASNVERTVSNIATSHLPDLQLFNSAPSKTAPEKATPAKPTPVETALLSSVHAVSNFGKQVVDAVTHNPVQAAEAVAVGAAASVVPGGLLLAGAVGAEMSNKKVQTATVNIAKQMGDGMVDEVEHHPVQLLESAAIGLGTGIAIGAAAAGAVALGVLAAPEVAIGAAVVGGVVLTGAAVAGGIEAYQHRDEIIHNTEVMANPGAYSASDLATARKAFQNFGGETLNAGVGLVASIPGGFIGSAGVSAAVDALKTAAVPAISSLGDAVSDGANAMVPGIMRDVADAGSSALSSIETDASNITNEPELRQAFQSVLADARTSGLPTTIKIDATVPLTDASGAAYPKSQASVLLDEMKSANPSNNFFFSKPELNPGDPGYTEFPTPQVSKDNLYVSTKENAITLQDSVTMPNGANLPAGTKFAVGTTYDGTELKSALPGGKVWAEKPDGTMVEVAGAGQSTTLPGTALSPDEKSSGQIAQLVDANNKPNHLIVRSAPNATDPDGRPLLDVYPSDGTDYETLFKPGTQDGLSAARGKVAEHQLLEPNITVEARTGSGVSTARGSDQSYFMRSGYGDAQDATAKNYFGPTSDAQSATELQRIRALQGLSSQ